MQMMRGPSFAPAALAYCVYPMCRSDILSEAGWEWSAVRVIGPTVRTPR